MVRFLIDIPIDSNAFLTRRITTMKKTVAFFRIRSYNVYVKNSISLRGGVRFSTGGKVREPRRRLIWCDSKTDSIVWMREEGYDLQLNVDLARYGPGYLLDIRAFSYTALSVAAKPQSADQDYRRE